MSDTAELRLFAQVCRALSERARDPDDKVSWQRLALKWQRMESMQDFEIAARERKNELIAVGGD